MTLAGPWLQDPSRCIWHAPSLCCDHECPCNVYAPEPTISDPLDPELAAYLDGGDVFTEADRPDPSWDELHPEEEYGR